MHHIHKTIALFLALAAATSYKPEAVSLGVKAHKPYAVYRAARANDETTLQTFISASNAVEEKEGQQPWPAYAKEALELIEKKVDINAKDKYGETPLHTAAKAGDTATVWALIAKGAKVNAKTTGGPLNPSYTPLHLAAANGREAVAKLLLANGAKATVNAKDNYGYTPLRWAAQNGHKDVATLLIDNKADINAKDNNGYTPLHYAAEKGHEAVATLLRKHGGHE